LLAVIVEAVGLEIDRNHRLGRDFGQKRRNLRSAVEEEIGWDLHREKPPQGE
jgi:hypothetical protein